MAMRYHGLRISLCRARITIIERHHQLPADYIRDKPIFMDIQSSAEEISKMVEKFTLGGNSGFDHVLSVVVGALIFESGLMHLLGSYVSTDPIFIPMKVQRIREHIQALGLIGAKVPRCLQLASILTTVSRLDVRHSRSEHVNLIKETVKGMLEDMNSFQ